MLNNLILYIILDTKLTNKKQLALNVEFFILLDIMKSTHLFFEPLVSGIVNQCSDGFFCLLLDFL